MSVINFIVFIIHIALFQTEEIRILQTQENERIKK